MALGPTGRVDKYDGKAGGYRAPLAADLVAAEGWTLFGVGLDANGNVVIGAGNTGIKAVLVQNGAKSAGDIVDNMTNGEFVDCVGLTAGTNYTANTVTGLVSNAAPSATQIAIGFTVEAKRLVVRVK